MANACCSIEMEPKTLSQGQLHRAREVAADVVQKMEPVEASTQFIEETRVMVRVNDDTVEGVEEGTQPPKPAECKEKADLVERPCQCSCSIANEESPEQVIPSLREPLSAPF